MKLIITESQLIKLKQKLFENIGDSKNDSSKFFLLNVKRRLGTIYGNNPRKINNTINNFRKVIEIHNLDDAKYAFEKFLEKEEPFKPKNDEEKVMPEKLKGMENIINKPVDWFLERQKEFEAEMKRRKEYDKQNQRGELTLNESNNIKFRFFMKRFIRDFIN